MSSLFFCGNFCNADDKQEMEIDMRKSIRSSSMIARNSRDRRIEMGSDNREYVVDYFLYKVNKDTDSNFSKKQMGLSTNRGRVNEEPNFYFSTRADSTGKPNFRPSKIYQQKSPDQYVNCEQEEEDRSSRAIDLRASNTTPQLAFETSTYLNNHSPLLTESSHNLVEQTFGEFNKNTLSPKATSSKSKKYVYYSHMSAWKEKRKHIKKQQKMKRITIDKLQENSYIISEIESFSTLAVPGNNTQKFDTINIGNMSNNNLSIENFHNANNHNLLKNESPASTPHFEIQNFNNIQIHSKKCQPVLLIGDTNSFLINSEKDASDTKERNKSSFSSQSYHGKNLISNLKNDLNNNQIYSKIISKNQRYDYNYLSANESENDIINMNINHSSSNMNISYNSKQANVEHANALENLNESEIISLDFNKKITLNPEKDARHTANYVEMNKQEDEVYNNLKNNLGLNRQLNLSDNASNTVSCIHCEEFYKISILYNVNIKEMKCLYCDSVLNRTSLDLYRMKYNQDIDDQHKNNYIINQNDIKNKYSETARIEKTEKKVNEKGHNKKSFRDNKYEINENNMIRLYKANKEKNNFTLGSNRDSTTEKENANNIFTNNIYDKSENDSIKMDSVKQHSLTKEKSNYLNNINLENLFRKKKMMNSDYKQQLNGEMNTKEIYRGDNLKRKKDYHQMKSNKNDMNNDKTDSLYKLKARVESLKESEKKLKNEITLSINNNVKHQDNKSEDFNDSMNYQYLKENYCNVRDPLNKEIIIINSQEHIDITKNTINTNENERYTDVLNNHKDNKENEVDIYQDDLENNRQEVLSDVYLMEAIEDSKNIEADNQSKRKTYDHYYQGEENEINHIVEVGNDTFANEHFTNDYHKESYDKLEVKVSNLIVDQAGNTNEVIINSLIYEKDNNANIAVLDPKNSLGDSNIGNIEKIEPTAELGIIKPTFEHHEEKNETDYSLINFQIDMNKTNISKILNNNITMTLESPINFQFDDRFDYDLDHIVLGNYLDDEVSSPDHKTKKEHESKVIMPSKFGKSTEKVIEKIDDDEYNIKDNQIYKEIMGNQFNHEKEYIIDNTKNDEQSQSYNLKNNDMSIIYECDTYMREEDSSVMNHRRIIMKNAEVIRSIEQEYTDNKNTLQEFTYGEDDNMRSNYLNQVFSQREEEKIDAVYIDDQNTEIKEFNKQDNPKEKNVITYKEKIEKENLILKNSYLLLEQQQTEQMALENNLNFDSKATLEEKNFSHYNNLIPDSQSDDHFIMADENEKIFRLNSDHIINQPQIYTSDKQKDEQFIMENQDYNLKKFKEVHHIKNHINFESINHNYDELQDLSSSDKEIRSSLFKDNFKLNLEQCENFNILKENKKSYSLLGNPNDKQKFEIQVREIYFIDTHILNRDTVRKSYKEKFLLEIQTGENFSIENINYNLQDNNYRDENKKINYHDIIYESHQTENLNYQADVLDGNQHDEKLFRMENIQNMDFSQDGEYQMHTMSKEGSNEENQNEHNMNLIKKNFQFDIQHGDNLMFENKDGNIAKIYENHPLIIEPNQNFNYENEENIIEKNMKKNNIVNIKKGDSFKYENQKFDIVSTNYQEISDNTQNLSIYYKEDSKIVQDGYQLHKEENFNHSIPGYNKSGQQSIIAKVNLNLQISKAVENLILNEKPNDNDNKYNKIHMDLEIKEESSISHIAQAKHILNFLIKDSEEMSIIPDKMLDNQEYLDDKLKSNARIRKHIEQKEKNFDYVINNEVVNITLNEKIKHENKEYETVKEKIDMNHDILLTKTRDENRYKNTSRRFTLEEIIEGGDEDQEEEEDNIIQSNHSNIFFYKNPSIIQTVYESAYKIDKKEETIQKKSPFIFNEIIEGADAELAIQEDIHFSQISPIQIEVIPDTNQNEQEEDNNLNLKTAQEEGMNAERIATEPIIKLDYQDNYTNNKFNINRPELINHILIDEVEVKEDIPEPAFQVPTMEAAIDFIYMDDVLISSDVHKMRHLINNGNKFNRNTLIDFKPDLSKIIPDHTGTLKEIPKEDLRPIRIKRKDLSNATAIVNAIQNELKLNSNINPHNLEKERTFEKKLNTTKYVNDIFKFKEKKFDDISTIANSAIFNTRRGSMIVNGSSNLLNSDIKKNAFKSKLSFKEQPAIDSVVDSLKANLLNDNNTSDSLNTQKILGENEVLIKHKLSENSTSLQSKGHSRVSSGKNTLNGKSETITQPSAPVIIRRASEKMLTRRASEKMLTNKSLILPNYDFKRSSQKVTTIKGMFGISPNEPLNVTEKKLAMAEILNKGQNENSNRLTDKKLTDKPKTGFFGDLIKTPVIERNQRKSILTMIHKKSDGEAFFKK